MHKLGDQWVEVIDGQEHMVKAVVGCCRDCLFVKTNYKGFEPICEKPSECPTNVQYIIKDLGILKDGLLPCPFCGEYPEILKGNLGYRIRHVCRDSYVMSGTGIYETEQQTIDAWNRRA